jgi:hypothetical protein
MSGAQPHVCRCMESAGRTAEAAAANALWLKQNTKKCPSCLWDIQKEDGCLEMKCRHCMCVPMRVVQCLRLPFSFLFVRMRA